MAAKTALGLERRFNTVELYEKLKLDLIENIIQESPGKLANKLLTSEYQYLREIGNRIIELHEIQQP